MLNFKLTFSLSSFTFIKRLFSSSSLSAIRVVSSLYLRLLIFFPAICGKFWKKWEYQTIWPASWETYMQVRKQVRTGHGTTQWFQIGKGVRQGCILSPCLFNLYAEYIMRNTGLDEAQVGIKIARRNINNLSYADDTTFMAESKEELKSLVMKVRGGWKSWLKAQHSENEDHGIWSHHFMGNRWGNSGNSGWLYFGGLQNHCR